jgi:triacylglycerol lipase
MTANEGVILLHGLCRTRASMAKMASALSSAGFVVENVNHPSRSQSISNLSDRAIPPALDRLQSCPKIHFVTHSMGGILVWSYLSRHQTDPTISPQRFFPRENNRKPQKIGINTPLSIHKQQR